MQKHALWGFGVIPKKPKKKKNTQPLPPQAQKSAVNIDHIGQLNPGFGFTAARFIFWRREQRRVEGRLEDGSLKYSCPQLLLRLLPGKCDAEISMQSFCPLNMAPAACDKPQWTEQSYQAHRNWERWQLSPVCPKVWGNDCKRREEAHSCQTIVSCLFMRACAITHVHILSPSVFS